MVIIGRTLENMFKVQNSSDDSNCRVHLNEIKH